MPTYIRVKDLANAATTPATDDFILLSGTANGARKISRADFLTAVAGFYTADPSTYKLATLDSGNKVLVSQLPSSAFSYKGTWAASTNTPTLANGTGTAGDTYYASDSGSVNFGAGSISFLAGDAVVYDGSVWQKVPDVVNLLDGKGTLDEAKTTLEIPDVGTSPQEVPNNGMLGSMAYQSADSVAVAELQIESTTGTATTQALTVTDGSSTNFVVQEDGKVGIGGTPNYALDVSGGSVSLDSDWPLYFGSTNAFIEGGTSGTKLRLNHSAGLNVTNAGTTHLAIDSSGTTISGTSAFTLDVYRPATGYTNAAFLSFELNNDAAERTSYALIGGRIIDDTDGSESGELVFRTKDSGGALTTRWSVSPAGNLVSSGGGIDLGSGASTTISDYEEGYHETTVGTDGTGSITLYASHDRMTYTKIGNIIQINGMFAITSVSSPTGNVTFSLPVAVPTLTDNAGYVGGAVYFQDYGTSNTAVPFRCDPGTSTMTIFVDSSTLAANDKFAFNFTYRTTAS